MTNFLLLGNVIDLQTGLYIGHSIKELGHKLNTIDIRKIYMEHGTHNSQEVIKQKINELTRTPDIILVLKGVEMTEETIRYVKEKFKDASLVNWFFDVYLGNLPIWKTETYFSTLKLFDYYFCSLKGVADKLKEKGFTNVHHLGEACFPLLHSPQYMNNFQKNKYGSDVAFCGSVGFKLQHPNRIPILKRICEEGFDIKIWGNLVGSKASIPSEIKSVYKGMPAINDVHSMVCQSSLINLGIDQMPDLDMSFSARVYRILCAGGLYLSTATKGLDKIFEINKEGESIKPTQDLVVFYDEDDLIKKLDFLLEHEQIRKSIAENGRKKVQDITFEKRIKEMLEVVKK